MDDAAGIGAGLRALLAEQPIGALGTLHGDDPPEPFVSMVPVAWLPGRAEAVIHISALAPHTRDLQRCARASLMLLAGRQPGDEPLALARLTLQVRAEPLPPDSPGAAEAREVYQQRFAGAALTMPLVDFQLWRLVVQSARYVAGFGRAHALTADRLSTWLAPQAAG